MIAAYLKLSGDAIGEIKGAVRDRDAVKDGGIALVAVEHGIASPTDSASGLIVGRRQHLPLTVTKATDNTSPFFYQLMARNEPIRTAEIFFFGQAERPGLAPGREILQYKITLKKAWVVRVEFVGHTDAAAQESNRFPLTEKISLTYDSIHWEWMSPKASTEDMFGSVKP